MSNSSHPRISITTPSTPGEWAHLEREIIDKLNAEGKNAFMEYQLPYSVITLKQGAGRLIRDEKDRGVLMLCDPRLISKSYGKRIWQSLPPFKRTRDLAEVQAFFQMPEQA